MQKLELAVLEAGRSIIMLDMSDYAKSLQKC